MRKQLTPNGPPDPSHAATAAQFVEQLNRLRRWAGQPSYRVLRELAGVKTGADGARIDVLPASTAHEILAGKRLPRLPRLDFVESFVAACLRKAGLGPAEIEQELERWRQSWRILSGIGPPEMDDPPARPPGNGQDERPDSVDAEQEAAPEKAALLSPPLAPTPTPASEPPPAPKPPPLPKRRLAALLCAALLLFAAGIGAGVLIERSSAANTSPPARPAAARYPGVHDTGVPPGTELKRHEGDLVVRTPGARVTEMLVTGRIIVQAADVVIGRTRIVPAFDPKAEGCRCAIQQTPAARKLVVEDVEISGSATESVDYGIAGWSRGLTVRRADIAGVERGVAVSSDAVVEDSYIHDLSMIENSPGGVFTTGGDSNIVVRRNTILNPYATGAAVLFYSDTGALTGVRVEQNLLAGGGHALILAPGAGSTGIQVTENAFSRHFFGESGRYGPVDEWEPERPGNLWRDNVWHGTRLPVVPE